MAVPPRKRTRSTRKKASARIRQLGVSAADLYTTSPNGRILQPRAAVVPVPPARIKKGIAAARESLRGVLDEFEDFLTTEYAIKDIQLEIAFSAKGEFLGLGVGGATSIKVTIAPKSQIAQSK
jgi:hypothetical protein